MNNELNTKHYQALRRAFDTAWPGPIGQPILLEKGHLRLQVFPRDGARITSLQAFGFEVLRQWEPQRKAFQYGCFPMVPWAGRLGDATLTVGRNSTHYLLTNRPMLYMVWPVIHHGKVSNIKRIP